MSIRIIDIFLYLLQIFTLLPASYNIEPLNEDEIAFLTKKYKKESKAFMLGMNAFLILAVSIPFLVANMEFNEPDEHAQFIERFLNLLAITIIVIGIIGWVIYAQYVGPLKKDLTHLEKVVEHHTIDSSVHLIHRNTYHFYIQSMLKASIEVSEEFFNSHQVGDEINIEYSRYSKEYFGYF